MSIADALWHSVAGFPRSAAYAGSGVMNKARIFGTFLALGLFLTGGGAAARPDRGVVLRAVVKGSGRVVTADGRLNCRTRCAVPYPRGSIRTLTARPAAHYLFTRWSGDCIGTAPNCDVALDRDTSVRSGFVGGPAGVVISVGGPGHVTSTVGINCGPGSHVCSIAAPYASEITLTPVPDAGGRFGGWDGPCAAAGTGPCTVRVDSPVTETAAAFGHSSPLAGDQPLTVTLDGSATSVTSQPAGIACPPTCRASFPSGTIVTLHSNSRLWTGACTGETLDRCALVIDAPTEVGVTPEPPPPVPSPRRTRRVDVTVSGAGLVTSRNAQMRCGFAPKASFHCQMTVFLRKALTKVSLRANPGPGARFVRWGGLCRGRKPACVLTFAIADRPLETYPLTGLFRSTR
jgi:hypothetical protein